MKQCYFLVMMTLNGIVMPLRIFLQYKNAVGFGRNYATKVPAATVTLYKQPISNTGEITGVGTLLPWKPKEIKPVTVSE